MFHFWRNSLVLNCLILNKDNSKPVNYVVMKPGEKCNLRSVFKELQVKTLSKEEMYSLRELRNLSNDSLLEGGDPTMKGNYENKV